MADETMTEETEESQAVFDEEKFQQEMQAIQHFCADAYRRRKTSSPPTNAYEVELDAFNAMEDEFNQFGADANRRRRAWSPPATRRAAPARTTATAR